MSEDAYFGKQDEVEITITNKRKNTGISIWDGANLDNSQSED